MSSKIILITIVCITFDASDIAYMFDAFFIEPSVSYMLLFKQKDQFIIIRFQKIGFSQELVLHINQVCINLTNGIFMQIINVRVSSK